MKSVLAIMLIGAALCPCTGISQDCRHNRHSENCRNHTVKPYRPSYFIGNGDVYFDGQKIDGASAPSFIVLNDGYARDNWNVYYLGKPVKEATSNSFIVFDYGYAKDNWNVYYLGKLIKGASAQSFKVMYDGYAKDNWNTYYWGRRIGN